MKLLISTTALFALAPSLLVRAGEEIMMESGDTLEQGTSRKTSNGMCKLRLQVDGNLVTQRKVDGVFKTAWASGPHEAGVETSYSAHLQKDGNLVVRNQDQVAMWSTNSDRVGRFRPGYNLVFDDDMCRLRIREANPGYCWLGEGKCTKPFWCQQPGEESSWCNPVYFKYVISDNDYHDVWWENIHDDNLAKDGLLIQQGEMITSPGDYYPAENVTLRVQQDCNLVGFKGNDLADKGSVVWSSQTGGDATDCYFYADYDRVALFPGKFDKNLPTFSDDRGDPLWELPSEDGEVGYWLEFLGYWWYD